MSYISAGSLQNGGSSIFVETFVDATDYTAGTTTQLTLDNTPASENTMWIFFDGVVQHHTEYSVAGNVVSFTSAIPIGVAAIEIQNNTELRVGVPSDSTITYNKLASEVQTITSNPNILINPSFQVWQRGTTHVTTLATTEYNADRWIDYVTGAAPTISKGAAQKGDSLSIAGIVGNTACNIGQRIEGTNVEKLTGGPVTFSCQFYTDEPLLGLTWNVHSADAVDDFAGGTTQRHNGTFGTLVSGWNDITFTINSLDTNMPNGMQVELSLGAIVAGKTRAIAQAKLERGSVVTEFTQPTIAEELAKCQRYLPAFVAAAVGNEYMGYGNISGSSGGYIHFPFIVTPRVPPTGVTVSAVSHFNLNVVGIANSVATAITFGVAGLVSARLTITGTGSPYTSGHAASVYTLSADAKLLFTGCEL